MGDGADRQAVITDHPIVGDGDTDLRAAGRLVVEGEAAKVSIEVFVPAVERIDRVGAVQFADCPARRGGGITGPSSSGLQGAGVHAAVCQARPGKCFATCRRE